MATDVYIGENSQILFCYYKSTEKFSLKTRDIVKVMAFTM